MKKNVLAFVALIITLSFSSVKLFAQDIPGGSADGGVEASTSQVSASTTVSASSSLSSTSFVSAFPSFFKTCSTSGTCSHTCTPCTHATCYRSNIVEMFLKGYLNCSGLLRLFNSLPKGCK